MSEHVNVYHSVSTVENYNEIHLDVQRFLEANLEKPTLRITDYVQAKGTSQRQIQSALSWHDTTWSRMLLNVRMQRAKELLRYSGETLETVAERAGYATVGQFSRTFKAEEGMEPEEFRNQ